MAVTPTKLDRCRSFGCRLLCWKSTALLTTFILLIMMLSGRYAIVLNAQTRFAGIATGQCFWGKLAESKPFRLRVDGSRAESQGYSLSFKLIDIAPTKFRYYTSTIAIWPFVIVGSVFSGWQFFWSRKVALELGLCARCKYDCSTINAACCPECGFPRVQK